MRVAWYPGSFFPWHEGHKDVLLKAMESFEHVVVAVGVNPDKEPTVRGVKNWRRDKVIKEMLKLFDTKTLPANITVIEYQGFLKDAMKNTTGGVPDAIVKGLRNSADFEYEKIQQYYNEDLGLKCPTFYIIADRKLVHISSSAIRAIAKVKK
jgi:pantetheine-phosphate adenylyltransferase